MTQNTLNGQYRDVELVFVRVAFSRRLRGIGRPSMRKVIHLVVTVVRIALARVRTGATVLYYPPTGAELVPMYRDMVLLLSTRWMFEKTVFHFHGGGVSELYPELPPWLQILFRKAFYGADVGIRTSERAPEDPRQLRAKLELVIANGVDDAASRIPASAFAPRDLAVPTILFVGLLRASKGVFVLLDACVELKNRGVPFRLELVGEFHSTEVEAELRRFLDTHHLWGVVQLRGVLVGEEKERAYARASVFAFPSFFEHETFGLVLVEAMQFGLPIVATSWRGIPTVVEDGVNGYLVPAHDTGALAEGLESLLVDGDLRTGFGQQGRRRYEANYTLPRYHCRMQEVFDLLRREAVG